MKSIFEIQDGDAVEEEYAVPGYPITVRTIGSLLDGGVRLEVYFGGRHDHYLTSTLHRFDGYDRNRDTMLKVGMWLQKECARADEIIERAILGDLMTPGCLSPRARERREASADEIRARIGAPQDINTARFSGEIETRHYNCRSSIQSVPRETLEEGVRAHFGEGGKAPWPDKSIQELAREQHEREIRESPEGRFLVECLRRDGVEVVGVRYDLLGDRFDVECRSTNGQYFTAGVPVKAVRRGSVSQVQDHVRCPWCGRHEMAGQVTVVCDDGVDRLFRRTCGECKDRTRDLEALVELFRALHALPSPVADATAALLAEQCAAGGVDCDATRALARQRVLAELHVAGHVEWAVRAIHRGALARLARTASDNTPVLQAAMRAVVASLRGAVLVPRPGYVTAADLVEAAPPLEDFVRGALQHLTPSKHNFDLRNGSVARALVDAGRAYAKLGEVEWPERS